MKILVTGGCGYIGSHTCVELLSAGHEVVVIDNLSNSKRSVLPRVIEHSPSGASLCFEEADLRDERRLVELFEAHQPEAVIHFAGLKAVGESVAQSLRYYDNNVSGTISLLKAMDATGVKTLIFSSSATVYGEPERIPLTEDCATRATNPYGRSKLMIEELLRDLCVSDAEMSVTLLRYFNPVGAHPSGDLGEDPSGVPNNLLPYIAQVAVGRLPKLRVFGDDYPTSDGTGVRDYIHVIDLALGHLASLDAHHREPGCHVYNLGTGSGLSVHELREAFERACGKAIPFEVVGRRAGDIASCWADPSHAQRGLGWVATRNVDEMVSSAWRWQSQNPFGFPEDERS
jgi:UDP-glucose 4-epimerase